MRLNALGLLKNASKVKQPVLLVHSRAAAIPQGVDAYLQAIGKRGQAVWLDETTRFQFYDDQKTVTEALKSVTQHFNKTL